MQHLRYLVLDEAPENTLESDDEPELDLDDVSQEDPARRALFEEAGFEVAYSRTFVAGSRAPRYQGLRMISRAYLFSDPAAGLEAIRTSIEREGRQLVEKSPPMLDRPGFTLSGTLDDALPPGVALVWQKKNVILLLAVVALVTVSESELRDIVREIDQLEPPLHPVQQP
jgi:hypothetical protein